MLLQMAEFNSFLWPIFHLCLCVCVYTYIYIFNPWVGIDPWLGYLVSSHSLGRSPGEGKGCPLQYSGLENFMDCIDHAVAKSQTQLSDLYFTFEVRLGP